MNSERSQAYGRVMKMLGDLGPAKLHADEQEVIRDAADTLLFTEGAGAEPVLDRVDRLASRLVESGRLLEETAEKLISDLENCGPASAVAP
jgi:hypothetical protein